MNRKEIIVIQAAQGFPKNKSVGDASEIALKQWVGRANGRQYEVLKEDSAQCIAEVKFDDFDTNASAHLVNECDMQKIEVKV